MRPEKPTEASPSCDAWGCSLSTEDVRMFAPAVSTAAGPRDISQTLLWSPEGEARTAGRSHKGTVPVPRALSLLLLLC